LLLRTSSRLPRVRRVTYAITGSASAITGSTSVRIEPGSQPATGNHLKWMPKISASNGATTNPGTAMPMIAIATISRSDTVFCLSAARAPSGIPTRTATASAQRPSVRLTGSPCLISSVTVNRDT
jgi:hypothetical protein